MLTMVDNFDAPSHRISGNDKRTVTEFPQRGAKLFGFPGLNLFLVIFSVRWQAFKTTALVRSPFVLCTQPLQGFWLDSNTLPSCAHRCRGRSHSEGAGSCRSLALAFRVRRWKWGCWSNAGSWLTERTSGATHNASISRGWSPA